jgi:hypothetical protein
VKLDHGATHPSSSRVMPTVSFISLRLRRELVVLTLQMFWKLRLVSICGASGLRSKSSAELLLEVSNHCGKNMPESFCHLRSRKRPDTSAYNDEEVVYRVKKRHHAGIIVRSPKHERVIELLDSYAQRFADDFVAVVPPPERPE